MENFILNYSEDEKTSVIYNDIIYHTEVKPNLSFSYHTLYCESPTEVYFYIEGDIQYALTNEQIEECYQFAKNFVKNGDYNVYAYDPNEDNNYQGCMLKSTAINLSYKWTVIEPDNEASFWNSRDKKWNEYYASLDEYGYMHTDIDRLCNICVKFFTKEEYDNFPKPEHDVDRWDFMVEKWVDKRNIDDVKYQYTRDIRDLFEQVRCEYSENYVPPYEQDTWRIQIEEAKAFINDNNAKTPYIDTFLKIRTDKTKPTKIELVNDILSNSEKYTIDMATINGNQWNYLKKLQACKTGYDCDAVFQEVMNYCEHYKRVFNV